MPGHFRQMSSREERDDKAKQQHDEQVFVRRHQSEMRKRAVCGMWYDHVCADNESTRKRSRHSELFGH